jgi:heme oxygenase
MQKAKTSGPLDAPGLRDRLRQATQPAHQRLEVALGLLDQPVSPNRILSTLQAFHGFHAVWEPALALVLPAALLAPRLKLGLLERDLRLLGVPEASIRSSPTCGAAQMLCRSEAAAAGSLYVMEGGTLGGQVIVRELAHTGWFSKERASYWNPYGSDTGRRWTETLAYLESLPAAWADEAIASAIACFELLQSWLLQEQRATLG